MIGEEIVKPLREDAPILIGLGANLSSAFGPPQVTLEAALARLQRRGPRVTALARWRRTPAWPPGSDQPDYVNGAALLETDLGPEDLLRLLLEIEAQMGRTREKVWGPRVCDLDLLVYGDRLTPDVEGWRRGSEAPLPPTDEPFLILPHPRLHLRAFALDPAAELTPDWVHPVLGRTMAEMAEMAADLDGG